MATSPEIFPTQSASQPAWDVALLFPIQGDWSENDYLALDTKRLVELVDGSLEVLPVPTITHQLIVWFLAETLRNFVAERKFGTVLFAPMPVRVRAKTFREPDVVYVPAGAVINPGDKNVNAAALVMEVVSEDDRSHKRDYEEKRSDYAAAGISEYWIIDPFAQRVTVLVLEAKEYRELGHFTIGQQAISQLLPGFAVDVSAVFAAGQTVS